MWDIRSSGLLRTVYWYFLTDISGQNIIPNFRGQEFQEHGTEMLSRNVRKELQLHAE